MAGVNVIAADSTAEAEHHFLEARRRRTRLLFGRGQALSPADVDAILASPSAQHVDDMLRISAVGVPDTVVDQLGRFAAHIGANELILAGAAPDKPAKLRTFELIAAAYGPAAAA